MNDNNNSLRILRFYEQLNSDFPLPEGVAIMDPYRNEDAMESAKAFYCRFYADEYPRIVLFGINPGRFGAGITGVPFTDPIRLEEACGIKNDFRKKPELSSEFVYEMIDAYGGAELFYRHFFVSAVCPLGFVRDGRNLNYYDDKMLLADSEPFIVEAIRRQQEIFPGSELCFCLGRGTNYAYFRKLNEKYLFFKQIIPLPHPRWVMQYRRKKKGQFVQMYVDQLGKAAAGDL